MAFTNEQIERYSRHIILKEVGVKGQKKLLDSKVLIIGAGGLGAPAAMYLAAAGVGTIGIADADEVDLSNLQRQIIHATKDVGKAKVLSAKETMEAMNPDIKINTYRTFVSADNIMDLIKISGSAYDLCTWGRSLLQMCIQKSTSKGCSTYLQAGRCNWCYGWCNR